MTERQEKFCFEFIRCGNATEAYKAAGYDARSENAAAANASRLLRNDKVKAKIAELKEKANEGNILDAASRRRILSEIATASCNNAADRIRALDVMNKMDGLYITRAQLSGADGGAVVLAWEGAERGV